MQPLALFAFLWVLLPFTFCKDDTCVLDGRDGVNGVPGRDGLTGAKGEKGAPGEKVMCDMNHIYLWVAENDQLKISPFYFELAIVSMKELK